MTALGPAAPAWPDPLPAPSGERHRPLDFTPFEAALERFGSDAKSGVDALVRSATVLDVQRAMGRGALTAEALTLYYLDRIRRLDSRLRTYLELNPHALEEARAADARRRRGEGVGPLLGVPISLKDNILTARPMHTTAGAEILKDHVAGYDAPLVVQLRASGAVILGKANLSELAGIVTLRPRLGGASALGGQVINPHGDFATGGSSAGSAAGVAAGLALMSVGTETSGSIMAPSSWNGVVGMKPGRGVAAGGGIVPLAHNNDSAGPIGRSVTDVAMLLQGLDARNTRYSRALSADALRGARVAVLRADILAVPGNEALLAHTLEALAACGAQVTDAQLAPWSAALGPNAMTRMVGGGVRFDLLPWLAAHGAPVRTLEDLLAYDLADPNRRSPYGLDALANYAHRTATMDRQDYAQLVARMGADATARLEAALAGAAMLVSFENYHSSTYATAGRPAITIPLGLRESGGDIAPWTFPTRGMPVGVTFIGRRGDDARLLSMAYAFEQATRARVEPPVG